MSTYCPSTSGLSRSCDHCYLGGFSLGRDIMSQPASRVVVLFIYVHKYIRRRTNEFYYLDFVYQIPSDYLLICKRVDVLWIMT